MGRGDSGIMPSRRAAAAAGHCWPTQQKKRSLIDRRSIGVSLFPQGVHNKKQYFLPGRTGVMMHRNL
eukprot:gene12717-biopygen7960